MNSNSSSVTELLNPTILTTVTIYALSTINTLSKNIKSHQKTRQRHVITLLSWHQGRSNNSQFNVKNFLTSQPLSQTSSNPIIKPVNV